MGEMFGGTEEALTNQFCCPFAFGLHAISSRCILIYGGVVRPNQRVEAAKGIFGTSCLIYVLSCDEALGIGSPQEFDAFQEVAEDFS